MNDRRFRSQIGTPHHDDHDVVGEIAVEPSQTFDDSSMELQDYEPAGNVRTNAPRPTMRKQTRDTCAVKRAYGVAMVNDYIVAFM